MQHLLTCYCWRINSIIKDSAFVKVPSITECKTMLFTYLLKINHLLFIRDKDNIVSI